MFFIIKFVEAWKSWEGYVRKKAKEKGAEDISLFVITGTTILPNAAPYVHK